MIDLSTLTIPPADVVPEPDEYDIRIWNAYWRDGTGPLSRNAVQRIAASLARRCRELEAEIERLKRLLVWQIMSGKWVGSCNPTADEPPKEPGCLIPPNSVIIDAAELASLQTDAERWEWAKQCAVDEDDGCFLLCPETAFLDRDYDPDAEAFEAAVDAAIAAEKGVSCEPKT